MGEEQLVHREGNVSGRIGKVLWLSLCICGMVTSGFWWQEAVVMVMTPGIVATINIAMTIRKEQLVLDKMARVTRLTSRTINHS